METASTVERLQVFCRSQSSASRRILTRRAQKKKTQTTKDVPCDAAFNETTKKTSLQGRQDTPARDCWSSPRSCPGRSSCWSPLRCRRLPSPARPRRRKRGRKVVAHRPFVGKDMHEVIGCVADVEGGKARVGGDDSDRRAVVARHSRGKTREGGASACQQRLVGSHGLKLSGSHDYLHHRLPVGSHLQSQGSGKVSK